MAVVVSYVMYTISPDIIEYHGTENMYLITFWVIMGLLRYKQSTFVEQESGSPTRVLSTDPFLQILLLCWIVSLYLLLYGYGS